MEMTEIVLALVSVVLGGTGIIVKSIMKDIKDLEGSMTSCQIGLHKDFVHREEFSHQIDKIEKMFGQIYTLLRETDKRRNT
jgi:hypothetical protein